jgi:GT2 family glycosyltransferase
MNFGFVIVCWNGAQFLPACLQSVIEQTRPPSVVIVIDNASSDESVEVVTSYRRQAADAGLELVLQHEPYNLGFTRGANAGLDLLRASASSVDVLALLNQDAAIDPAWCEQIATSFAADELVGAVGSKILYPNRLTVQHAGGFLERPRLLGRHFGHHNADGPSFQIERDVEFVTAAAMAIRLSAVAAVGGLFDEVFSPGYYEDVELCQRLARSGWKVKYCPRAVAVHTESSSFIDRAWRLSLHHRNRLVYALRWLADPAFRRSFCRAERASVEGELTSDERRALAAAYLSFVLVLPRAMTGRVPADEATAELLDELIGTFTELRRVALAGPWDASRHPED